MWLVRGEHEKSVKTWQYGFWRTSMTQHRRDSPWIGMIRNASKQAHEAPKTRSEYERWADFKLSFKWSLWQPICFALVTKMEWIRIDIEHSESVQAAKVLALQWLNQSLQRTSENLWLRWLGNDMTWYDHVLEHSTLLHVVTCSDLDTVGSVGPQVYVTKIDDKPAT